MAAKTDMVFTRATPYEGRALTQVAMDMGFDNRSELIRAVLRGILMERGLWPPKAEEKGRERVSA